MSFEPIWQDDDEPTESHVQPTRDARPRRVSPRVRQAVLDEMSDFLDPWIVEDCQHAEAVAIAVIKAWEAER